MAQKNHKLASNGRRLGIVALSLGVVGLGLAFGFFAIHNESSVSDTDNSEQIINFIGKRIVATKVPYKTNLIRSDNHIGTYMRPYKPSGYHFAVFPVDANLLQLMNPEKDEQKIDALLNKSFSKKVIKDKTVKVAFEYDSTLTVCYIELSKPDRVQTNIFGCADKLSYIKNAAQIKPIIGTPPDYEHSQDDSVYDTPGVFHGGKAGYDAALVPVTFSPYVYRDGYSNLDILQTTNLTAVNAAYYRTPVSKGWKPTNTFLSGYRTSKELCTSPDMENPDIKIAFSKFCEQPSSNNLSS